MTEQPRFWRVIDAHDHPHVVAASHFSHGVAGITLYDDEDISVAHFPGAIGVYDAADPGQVRPGGEILVGSPAASEPESTQDPRPCPGLTPYEALMGFAAWLTSRKEPVTMSTRHDAALPAELVHLFAMANQLAEEVSEHWPRNLRHPVEEAAGRAPL